MTASGQRNIHMPNRAEVWLVTLVGIGKEQQGTRPVVIVSENELNHSQLRLVIAAPVTGNRWRMVSRVFIEPPEGGLTKPSAIMCEQILRLDIDGRLLKMIGKV